MLKKPMCFISHKFLIFNYFLWHILTKIYGQKGHFKSKKLLNKLKSYDNFNMFLKTFFPHHKSFKVFIWLQEIWIHKFLTDCDTNICQKKIKPPPWKNWISIPGNFPSSQIRIIQLHNEIDHFLIYIRPRKYCFRAQGISIVFFSGLCVWFAEKSKQ